MWRLMVVTDRTLARRPLEETTALALEGGADAVQLREKNLDSRALFALAERLREIAARAGAAFIVNRRVDLALAIGADGVQLGWRSMSVGDARKLGGDGLKIGASCHSLSDVRDAESEGADYAILGPIFATPSKAGLVEPIGLEVLRAAARASKIPVLAVGGVAPGNVGQVRETGAAGAAVVSAIMGAEDPREAARLLAAR